MNNSFIEVVKSLFKETLKLSFFNIWLILEAIYRPLCSLYILLIAKLNSSFYSYINDLVLAWDL